MIEIVYPSAIYVPTLENVPPINFPETPPMPNLVHLTLDDSRRRAAEAPTS